MTNDLKNIESTLEEHIDDLVEEFNISLIHTKDPRR